MDKGPIFSNTSIQADGRVTPSLRECLYCDGHLRVLPQSTHNESPVVQLLQCAHCNTLYILEERLVTTKRRTIGDRRGRVI
jgi:hypothetical protein